LLVDAAGYYGALRDSLLRAERSIVLAGWDIDSRTPIRGDSRPDDGAPETLGPLLEWLVRRRRKLVVRVLLWDYSMLYALEREPLPRLNLDWRLPRRVKVCLDSRLPFGASHHEKLAVIDGSLAYCGGIDLTIRRWDRAAHDPEDDDRRDPDGKPYAPFHDLQMVVDGPAAAALSDLVLARWNRAAGARARTARTGTDLWPDVVRPEFRKVEIGIARTRPAYGGEPELRQVERAYLESIEQAEHLIYIENQYLTVDDIAAALHDRLRARPKLELIIVNPEKPSGWLEEQTMGQLRNRFLHRLAAADCADRVRVLFPWVAADNRRVAVMVHAKLMLVDDRLLHLGSSNLNRRSMGVDRECDLLIEAQGEEQRRAMAAIRHRLLAHHLGIDPQTVERETAAVPGLTRWLDICDSPDRGLSRVSVPEAAVTAEEGLLDSLADPERPIDPETFVGDLFGAVAAHPLRRRVRKLLQFAGLVALAFAVWRFTPLGEWADPERIGGALEQIESSPWRGPIVLACFVAGSFVFFPVTVLIAATAAALGPVQGFVWALAGSCLAAVLNFGAGQLLPERALESAFGSWIARVKQRLHRGGIVSIMILRNLPVAPFTVVNIVAGAARLRPLDFAAGTALGMAPGIAALTLLGDRLRGVWQDPGWLNIGLLAGAIAVWIGVAVGLQLVSNRLADGR
jgi:phosphatidylserine/phosphatidylglycerophosphate/cardiolipin synthase-like enzyme/uncharacterized membrane protein YdjX (TVP38/TMEM64 family)